MNWVWSEFGVLPSEARRIREEVFIQEQGFCNELDDTDGQSYHLQLMKEEKVIGTARLFWEDKTTMHIGRVAVEKESRGGSGSVILAACCEKAHELGAERVVLGAQCRAMGFYAKNGFQPFGDEFDDEGCPHQMMEKKL